MKYKFLFYFIALMWLPGIIWSQSASPFVVASGGGYFENATHSNSWTIGQLVYETKRNGNHVLTQGFQQPNIGVALRLKVLMSGPYDQSAMLMQDSLRSQGYLPLSEPYTGLGFIHENLGGNETIASSVLSVSGNDAIVDWIFIELRDKDDSAKVLATRSALIQRDGDVVDLDGISPLKFTNMMPGKYFVVVRHRNHLGVMTAQPVLLISAEDSVDFTNPSTAIYGSNAQDSISGKRVMWSGNVVFDNPANVVKYSGADNDRDQILAKIGGTIPTNVVSGYHQEDVNMDGAVKYSGLNNDRDIILVNIGGTVPTNVIQEKLP